MEKKRKQHLSESQLEGVVGGVVASSPTYMKMVSSGYSRDFYYFTGASIQQLSNGNIVQAGWNMASNGQFAILVGGPGGSAGWDFLDGTPTKAWINSFGAEAAAAFKSRYTSNIQQYTKTAWPGWGSKTPIRAK